MAAPKGLRYSERKLWEECSDASVGEVRVVLARLARTRNSAQNHAEELERVEAQRNQLQQHLEVLLSKVDDHRNGPEPGEGLIQRDQRLYKAVDQIRKEMGE